jgi:hypothetical protein
VSTYYPPPSREAGWLPPFCCTLMVSGYIHCCPPFQHAAFCVLNVRMCHALVKRDPFNTKPLLTSLFTESTECSKFILKWSSRKVPVGLKRNERLWCWRDGNWILQPFIDTNTNAIRSQYIYWLCFWWDFFFFGFASVTLQTERNSYLFKAETSLHGHMLVAPLYLRNPFIATMRIT